MTEHRDLMDKKLRSIIEISQLKKSYANGFKAIDSIDLEVKDGEIFSLLGPNGAGKTTLISIICGITNPSSGSVTISGMDNIRDYKKTRNLIGLVPQELTLSTFETVWSNVCFSCGLFGKKIDKPYLEHLLKKLSLWDKKDSPLMQLSGGMKRRVLIAKALSHKPKILFLDEPSAGVDVELRRDMFNQIRELKDSGVTIFLTTHYIEEAEDMADRVAIIDHGKIIMIEEKNKLMENLGSKQLVMKINSAINKIPKELNEFNLHLSGDILTLNFDPKKNNLTFSKLFDAFTKANLTICDISTKQSSLEEIFIDLVKI